MQAKIRGCRRSDRSTRRAGEPKPAHHGSPCATRDICRLPISGDEAARVDGLDLCDDLRRAGGAAPIIDVADWEHVSRNKVGVGVLAAPSLRLWKAVIGIRLTARQVRPIVAKENVSVGASEYSAASHLLVFHPEPEDPLRHRHQRLRYRADRIVRANRPTRILPTLRHSPPGLDQQHRRE